MGALNSDERPPAQFRCPCCGTTLDRRVKQSAGWPLQMDDLGMELRRGGFTPRFSDIDISTHSAQSHRLGIAGFKRPGVPLTRAEEIIRDDVNAGSVEVGYFGPFSVYCEPEELRPMVDWVFEFDRRYG